MKSFSSLKAHWAALISVSLASSRHQFTLGYDHKYKASASRGMPVYVPAFAGTHCAYPGRNGQAKLASVVVGYIPGGGFTRQSLIQVLTGLGVG